MIVVLIDSLLKQCHRNTITHVQLETVREMLLHGNYRYALELLTGEFYSLCARAEYHELVMTLHQKLHFLCQ